MDTPLIAGLQPFPVQLISQLAISTDELLTTHELTGPQVRMEFSCGVADAGKLSIALCDGNTDFHGGSSESKVRLSLHASLFERLAGAIELERAPLRFHLPSTLLQMAVSIRTCALKGESKAVYSVGKGLELLCETIRLWQQGKLVPADSDGLLSADESRRVMLARRIIEERWTEKLTLNLIARECGLNRAKLIRCYRDAFKCSVSASLIERRLSEACKMLKTTDLPISSIGYKNGYRSNTSFSRAFTRRFGIAPSGFRTSAL